MSDESISLPDQTPYPISALTEDLLNARYLLRNAHPDDVPYVVKVLNERFNISIDTELDELESAQTTQSLRLLSHEQFITTAELAYALRLSGLELDVLCENVGLWRRRRNTRGNRGPVDRVLTEFGKKYGKFEGGQIMWNARVARFLTTQLHALDTKLGSPQLSSRY